MKRKSPIALSLVKSSKSAIIAAIEIHNKPILAYRYEVVVLLIINAWELLLKAYIYKYQKNVKIFNDDGTTKPFQDCVGCVFGNLGNDFLPIQQNLLSLYKYRNDIAHFYTGILDPVIFLLVKKSIVFYSNFLEKHFNTNISKDSDLYLLPIGFKPLYSPVDYLSKTSLSEDYPEIIRSFIDDVIIISRKLYSSGIQESIISDFDIHLINVNRVKNADIVVAIDQSLPEGSRTIKIDKKVKIAGDTEQCQSIVKITRDKSISSGVVLHEELSNNLFDEINNIIQANKLMSPSGDQFHLGEEVYYRIYAEREHVDDNEEYQLLLAKTALTKYYAPGIYWFLHLKDDMCAKIILDFVESMKEPYVHAFLRIIVLLGDQAVNWLSGILEKRFKNNRQRPRYYWSFQQLIEKRKDNYEKRLQALRMNVGHRLELNDSEKDIHINDILNDISVGSKYLSKACLNVFNGSHKDKNMSRVLDILVYGEQLEDKASNIMSEISNI